MAAYRKLNRFVPFASNTVCDFTGFLKKSTEVKRQWDGLYGIPEAVSIRQPQDFAPNIIPTMTFPNTRFEYPPAPAPHRCPPDPAPGNVLSSTENFSASVWDGTAGYSGQFSNILNFPSAGNYLEQTYTAQVDAGAIWSGYFVLSGYGTITIGVGSPQGAASSEETVETITLGSAETEYTVNHIFANAQDGVRVFIERRGSDTAIQATVAITDCDDQDTFEYPSIV